MNHPAPETTVSGTRLYSVPDAARILNFSRTSIYKLINTGQLRAVRVRSCEGSTSKIRIPRSAIGEYLRDRQAVSGAA